METNTIIKIVLSVVLSLFLLALIGRKTRENFESQKAPDGFIENSEEASEQFGSQINLSSHPDTISAPSAQNAQCVLSTRTSNERSVAIAKDLAEAKRQLKEYVAKIKKERAIKNSVKSPFDSASNCSLLRYPAIL